jgi:8-oxo-dGTP pyrophosphatase MutT (NUDIX family)
MGKLMGVAGKAVVRKDGRILLLQRSLQSGFDPGRWELPGGKIGLGEDLVEALRREIQEEVGLSVKVGRPFTTWHFVKEPFWVTGVTFVCDYIGGEVRLSPEHHAHEWIEPDGYGRFPLATAVEGQIKSYLEMVKGTP